MAKFYRFPGTVRWLKFRPDQLDTKYDDDGVWTTDFFPDDPKAFKETGIQVEPKEDPTGTFFRLKRKKVLNFRDRETKEKKEVIFDPPAIRTKASGGSLVAFTGHDVGNGSRGTLIFSLFPLKRIEGFGHRWEGFDIDNLVEVTPDSSVPATEAPGGSDDTEIDEIPF